MSLKLSRRPHLFRLLAVIAAGGLLLALSGCGGSSKGSATKAGAVKGDVAKGKQIYLGTCAACHGQDAKGMPGLGKDLVNASAWFKQQSGEALVAFIKQGRPASDPLNTTKVDMPSKGGNPVLTDEDIVNVVAYVQSIQK